MATFLIELSPQDMQRRLHDALGVYVDAMRYPRGTEGQRASMWLEHTRRRGWKAVAAGGRGRRSGGSGRRGRRSGDGGPREAPPPTSWAKGALLGGLRLQRRPDQWWQQQVSQGLHRVGVPREEIARLMSSYFELTELHIHPAPRAAGSVRRWPAGCSPTVARPMCCCPPRRSSARPTARGGCTGGWASPTSSGATTSPAIPGLRDPGPHAAALTACSRWPRRGPGSGTIPSCVTDPARCAAGRWH